MNADGRCWQPSATPLRLQARAAMLARTREFFAARAVLEVETPLCVRHAVTDAQLQSLSVNFPGQTAPRYLHTSAEYAMKRLLAAGSGDIYQLCHVFRGGEHGPLHSPEFTMLEWYRLGFELQQMMQEVAALVQNLLGPAAPEGVRYLSYCDCMQQALGVDPLKASDAQLSDRARQLGHDAALLARCDRDQLLDLMMATRVGPGLGRDSLCFVHRYPASQAALARLDPVDSRLALRFELYLNGVELANGFEELCAADEQRARFTQDLQLRRARGLPQPPVDTLLLGALEHGLPPCSGVALGFDRLVMQAVGAASIDEVLSFSSSLA